MSSFLERQDTELVTQLVDYLKPKVFSLENDDLTSLYTPLVLMHTLGVRDQKLLKSVESLTLRRLHSLTHT